MSIINAAILDVLFLVLGLICLLFSIENPFLGVLAVIFLLLALPGKDCLEGRECLYTSPDLTLNNVAITIAVLIVAIIVILILLTFIGRQWTTAMTPSEPKTLQEKIDQVLPGSCFVYPNGRGGWKEYRKNEDSTVTPGKTHKTKDDVPHIYNL
jgi:hypothetical protein